MTTPTESPSSPRPPAATARARRRRRRSLTLSLPLSALLAAVVALTAVSCKPEQDTSPAGAQQPASAAAPATPICGVPPCDKYLSRGDTQTLDHTITGHPIATGIALHLVVSALCGGILCIWGEGVTFVYVQYETHLAAQNGECLRVHVLPQGREWQLVNLDASNQSPYCTA